MDSQNESMFLRISYTNPASLKISQQNVEEARKETKLSQQPILQMDFLIETTKLNLIEWPSSKKLKKTGSAKHFLFLIN
jgi:hypothetical protein